MRSLGRSLVLCGGSEPRFPQLQASLPISAFGLADGVGGWADRVAAQDFRTNPEASVCRCSEQTMAGRRCWPLFPCLVRASVAGRCTQFATLLDTLGANAHSIPVE